jgi:hypothetical protein
MTVTNMNGIAAWRFFIAREDQRNVVAAVVSTAGGSASPKTMLAMPKVKNIRRASREANALRTTRSTLVILRDDAALLSLA